MPAKPSLSSTRKKVLAAIAAAILAMQRRAEEHDVTAAALASLLKGEAPAIGAALFANLVEEFGTSPLTAVDISDRLLAAMRPYFESTLSDTDLAKRGYDAIVERLGLIVRTETQNLASDLAHEQAEETGDRIRRETTSGDPCERCIELEGDYDPPIPDECWEVPHPQCCCVWSVIEGVASMSNLNTAQRKALPLADFGDPDRRLFPCIDQDDVDSAAHLIGKAKDPEAVKRRIKAIAKRKGLKIPDAWQEDAAMALFGEAVLDGATHADGDMVVRTGLLFRAGDYPQHGLTATPADVKAMADAFTGGFVELEHFQSKGQHSILDGKCGEVRGVWASDDGTELWGDVAIPSWLDKLADASGHKVSAVIHKASKGLRGIGLVLEPQVSDAALMEAYTTFAKRHDTPTGQAAIQHVHDVATQHGAICNAGNATLASRHEASAIQQVHDTAVEHGATCSAVGSSNAPYATYSAPGVGATPPRTKEVKRMSWFEKFKTTLEAIPDEDPQAYKTAIIVPADPETVRLVAENDALKVATLALKSAALDREAAAFADGEVQALRVLPAGRDTLVAFYKQAAAVDASISDVATFAGGGTTSLVEGLKALFAALPAHNLTAELAPAPAGSSTLANKPANKDEMTPERRAVLMAATPLGQVVLNGKK